MKRLLAALALTAALLAAAAPTAARALTGDPTATVTAPASVQAGQPITFTVTIDQAGFAPTNGSQRITYRNPRTGSTINVANYTVIPMSVVDGGWTFTYTPSASEVGRVETFSVTVPVSQARIPRTIVAAAYFAVVAA